MKKMTFFLFSATVVILSTLSVRAQETEIKLTLRDTTVEVITTSSLMLDGAIRNLESGGSKGKDLTTSGLVGFRSDNEWTEFSVSIATFSTFDTVFGEGVKKYSNAILNSSLTSTSLSSITLEVYQRFFWRSGFQKYIFDKKKFSNDPPSNEVYHKVLANYNLDNLPWYEKHLGGRIYGNLTNSVWKDNQDNISNASILTIGATALYFGVLDKSPGSDISYSLGVGLTTRILFSDIRDNDDFRRRTLFTDKKFFWGPEIYLNIRVKNAYAKFTFPYFLISEKIAGLTGGQPIISIGISADIGSERRTATGLSYVGGDGVESARTGK